MLNGPRQYPKRLLPSCLFSILVLSPVEVYTCGMFCAGSSRVKCKYFTGSLELEFVVLFLHPVQRSYWWVMIWVPVARLWCSRFMLLCSLLFRGGCHSTHFSFLCCKDTSGPRHADRKTTLPLPHCVSLVVHTCPRESQDIKVEGLDVMKQLMERRKVELKEEEEAAEAKQRADREVSTSARFAARLGNRLVLRSHPSKCRGRRLFLLIVGTACRH